MSARRLRTLSPTSPRGERENRFNAHSLSHDRERERERRQRQFRRSKPPQFERVGQLSLSLSLSLSLMVDWARKPQLCLSVCLSVCLFLSLSVCLSVSACLSLSLSHVGKNLYFTLTCMRTLCYQTVKSVESSIGPCELYIILCIHISFVG